MYSRTKYLVSIRQGSKGGVLMLFLSLHPQFDNQTACTVPNMKNVISNNRGYESKQPCPPPTPTPTLFAQLQLNECCVGMTCNAHLLLAGTDCCAGHAYRAIQLCWGPSARQGPEDSASPGQHVSNQPFAPSQRRAADKQCPNKERRAHRPRDPGHQMIPNPMWNTSRPSNGLRWWICLGHASDGLWCPSDSRKNGECKSAVQCLLRSLALRPLAQGAWQCT